MLDAMRVRDMFQSTQEATMDESGEPTEAEVQAVIAEFGGDPRAAIRALLHDLAVLTLDRALTVSRGYVRGRAPFVAINCRPGGPNPEQGGAAGR